MWKGFIYTGLLVAALLPTGCLEGVGDVELDEGERGEAGVLGQSQDALGLNQGLRAKHSGKCIGIRNGSTNAGARLVQRECDGAIEQRFHIINLGKGSFIIVAANSGLCLEVDDGSIEEGARVVQRPCQGVSSQKFKLDGHSGGYRSIIARHSGLCLDVEEESTDDDVPIIQYSCHDGDNQRFRPFDAPVYEPED